jgi:D-beta-D-heptose 7-phosphate kinase/D-beta-D-heptose 1-phosphate adenosyltransferase
MFDFEKQFARFPRQTLLCIGDLMLDDFVYGDVARISPEAPAPVIAVKREDVMIGGAGNVARNIAALGAHCIFIGVIGRDEAGKACKTSFAALRRAITPHLVVDPSRPTTRKLRFVAEQRTTHLLRADFEVARPVDARIETALIGHAKAAMKRVGAVVLSDYAKGALTPRVIRAVIEEAKRHRKPIVVGPKGADFSIYKGATVITLNRKELAEATRHPVGTNDEVAAAAGRLARIVGSDAVLVTLSEAGMLLYARGREAVHVPAYPVNVRDVSGPGDTVAAALALMLSLGADFESAMRTANAAAAVVVGKPGTATLSVAELRQRILPAAALAPEEKIVFDHKILEERLDAWRAQDLRIGFTNGCFDLLHPGHIKVLAQARAACDRLVVGLNSDASVTRLKGKGRPVQNQHARAEILAALEAVDLVVVFPEDTPLSLIRRVRPNVLVKGGDYKREQVVGHKIVEANGGEVVLVDLIPGYSTSDLIRRSRSPKSR